MNTEHWKDGKKTQKTSREPHDLFNKPVITREAHHGICIDSL